MQAVCLILLLTYIHTHTTTTLDSKSSSSSSSSTVVVLEKYKSTTQGRFSALNTHPSTLPYHLPHPPTLPNPPGDTRAARHPTAITIFIESPALADTLPSSGQATTEAATRWLRFVGESVS